MPKILSKTSKSKCPLYNNVTLDKILEVLEDTNINSVSIKCPTKNYKHFNSILFPVHGALHPINFIPQLDSKLILEVFISSNNV